MTPADRLAAIRDRIARAARAARRESLPTLIAVSKTRGAEAIEALIAAGQRDFGENRVQEAQEKWPAIRARHPDVRLHMIGRLQSNKASEAAGLFDAIHSLDRSSLLDALAAAGRPTPCFVQVNIGAEEQKGGVAIDALGPFLATVRASSIPLAGLMCIPPQDSSASPYFALLADLARRHDVTGLSMGMSADYESATLLGATHLRIGSALFED